MGTVSAKSRLYFALHLTLPTSVPHSLKVVSWSSPHLRYLFKPASIEQRLYFQRRERGDDLAESAGLS